MGYTSPRYDLIVGWDNPLDTFFYQVFDTTVDDEETACVRWEGTTWRAIPTVEALQARLAGFAMLPETVCTQLRRDQEQATPRSPLQNMLRHLLQ